MRFKTFGLPLIGVEAEVMAWGNDREDIDVVAELERHGVMPPKRYSAGRGSYGPNEAQHNYHCSCTTCRTIGSTVLLPVQFKMQYDGTLTHEGAEFISSPFPASIPLIEHIADMLGIIGKDAIMDGKGLESHHGNKPEAGLHIHTSVSMMAEYMSEAALADAVRTYYFYFPEILLLASSSGYRRSLTYRLPVPDPNNHHGFLARSADHLEWRIFEADLTNKEYMVASMVIAAALTYLIQEPRILNTLEVVGRSERWDEEYQLQQYQGLIEPISMTVNEASLSEKRMTALTTVLEDLTFNEAVRTRLQSYLERAWSNGF